MKKITVKNPQLQKRLDAISGWKEVVLVTAAVLAAALALVWVFKS